MSGKTILVTAGPTHEAIDPVRFIGNHSSGKMGYALALSAAERGAEVFLVSGPTQLSIQNERIHIEKVTSAEQMYEASLKVFPQCDVAIMAAAVSDYAPERIQKQKVKKKADEWMIRLQPTKDIAASLGRLKSPGQILVGFALETDHELEQAEKKLLTKNFDFIVLNSLKDKGAGFGHDTNRISILDRHNNIIEYGLKSKERVAEDILDKLTEYV